jgi:hypothetical protein
MQWQMFITPALLGLPLNIYATVSYAVGSRGGKNAVHKKTPTMLKLAAVMAVLWTFVSVVPSAALYTDVTCVFPVGIAKGSSDLCNFLRCTVHILQCMLYWVLCAVIDLHLAVVNGMTPARRADFYKFYHIWCWGVSLLMLILVRKDHHTFVGSYGERPPRKLMIAVATKSSVHFLGLCAGSQRPQTSVPCNGF